jgi:hypothetical protein
MHNLYPIPINEVLLVHGASLFEVEITLLEMVGQSRAECKDFIHLQGFRFLY